MSGVPKIVKEFHAKLPKFPDGRINYTDSKVAAVVSVFLKYRNKILILKRSNKVLAYKGKWSAIGGYLDEPKPVKEKAMEEVAEELGVKGDNIASIVIAKSYESSDRQINRKWIIYPVLMELKKMPDIKMNWENTEYKWINPEELKKFDTIPGLQKSLKKVLK